MARLPTSHFHTPSPWRDLFGRPRPWRASLRQAAGFGSQVAICAAVLLSVFRLAGWPEVSWALITACIVLQPELKQSLTAALTRMASNIVGATAGMFVGIALGLGAWQLILALLICVLICSLARLDLGIRSGCAAVIIMMNLRSDHLAISGVERMLAVLAGCTVAVALQYTVARVMRNRLLKSLSAPLHELAALDIDSGN